MESKHILDYCDLCQTEMVRCATCNNNCCNGGSGEINGASCSDCNDAYNMQSMYWKDPTSVKFIGQKKNVPVV